MAVVFIAEEAVEQLIDLAGDAVEQVVGLVYLRAELFAQVFDGFVGGALVGTLRASTVTLGRTRVVGVVAVGIATVVRVVG
ncbi:hypothetical protein D3C85_1487550 [compost metagenome]